MLNILNYKDHPDNRNYIVFTFRSEDIFKEFASRIDAAGIEGEVHQDEDDRGNYNLVAIKQRHRKEAIRLNCEAFGKYRTPFIPNVIMKYLLLVIVFAAIGLSIMGYLAA